MKGSKQTSKTSPDDLLERERIKKIMAVPVNPRKTELYWLSRGRFQAVG
jgi:hypothetical protein